MYSFTVVLNQVVMTFFGSQLNTATFIFVCNFKLAYRTTQFKLEDRCGMPFDWRKNDDIFGFSLYDWELRCGSETWHVNSAVLIQNSPVLKGQISHTEFKERGYTDLEKHLPVNCVTPDVVNMFLNYCHYGTDSAEKSNKLVLDASNVIKFLRFCDVLLVLDNDEKLVNTIKRTLEATNVTDVKIAVQILQDLVNLGFMLKSKDQNDPNGAECPEVITPSSNLLCQVKDLGTVCTEVIAENLDLLSPKNRDTLQGNCSLLSMVLSKAKSCKNKQIGQFIAAHFDSSHCRCRNAEECFGNLSETILRSIHNFAMEDATVVFKMGVQFQQPKCREAALKVKALNFSKGLKLPQLYQKLEGILEKKFGQKDACEILCELLERTDLEVQSEDLVFDKILELQELNLSADRMAEIWQTCRFAYLSAQRYPQMLHHLRLLESQSESPGKKSLELKEYFIFSLTWRAIREVTGDAGLKQFLESSHVRPIQRALFSTRLSPRSSYDKEVHVCEYRANDPSCRGVLKGLGTKFGAEAYTNPVGKDFQVVLSRQFNVRQLADVLEPEPLEPVEISQGSDGTSWFKIDLGPRKRLKPSHCRFQVRGYLGSPEFEAKCDEIESSRWLGSELSPEWSPPKDLPDGWRSMTVSLGAADQACQLFQVILHRGVLYSLPYSRHGWVEIRNLELFGTLEISKKGFFASRSSRLPSFCFTIF